MGELSVIIVVFVCGLVAVFLECLLPGVVMGVIGLLAIVGSIVYAIAGGYTKTAVVLILVTVGFLPAFFLLWRTVAVKWFASRGHEEGFRSSSTVGGDLVGMEGEAVTALRPSGIAYINDVRCDVVTRGEMLEKGARVKVIEVSGNRVVVRRT